MSKAAVVAVLAISGCGDDDCCSGVQVDASVLPDGASAFSLTIDARPGISDVTTLRVLRSANGAQRYDDYAFTAFPTTIDLVIPSDALDLAFAVDATDASDVLVGRGGVDVSAGAASASVLLDPADFVVNTVYANDQFLTSDYEAVGNQLAVDSNGTATAVFRDECTNCDILARRFDADGVAMGNQFVVSTTQTTTGAMPAIAAAGTNTLAFWDFTATDGSGNRGVACRQIGASSNQVTITTDAADVVSAFGLSNGNVAVTWQVFMSPTYVVRAAIVGPTCASVVAPHTLSTSAPSTGMFGASRPHVTANGSTILYTWLTDDDLWVRTSTVAGTLSQETLLIPDNPSQTIEHVRSAPSGAGFALAVRWVSRTSTGPGKIETYTVASDASSPGPALLVSDMTLSDFASNKAFGLAARLSDSTLFVSWHTCTATGLCDVYGQYLRNGALVGSAFVIPTSTGSEQINPSAAVVGERFMAVWNDSSGERPDQSGSSVRARYVDLDP